MRWIKNLSVKKKILYSIGLSLIIANTLLGGIINFEINSLSEKIHLNLEEALIRSAKTRIKHLVNLTADETGDLYKNRAQKLNKLESKELINQRNNNKIFGESGYFFIYDHQGNVISLPQEQHKVGTNRWNLEDKQGSHIVRDLSSAAQNGGGFVEYFYPNPKTNQKEKVFAYAENIPGTNWFIGTGIYQSSIDNKLDQVQEILTVFKKELRGTFILFLAVVLIVLSFLLWKVASYIENNLDKMRNALHKLAKGKLNTELEVKGEDDFGKLANSFNTSIKEQRELIINLLSGVEDLSAYSDTLAASANLGNNAVQNTKELIENITAGIEEISATTEEVTSFAEESSAQTQTGKDNMNQTLNTIQQISSKVKGTVDLVEELGDSSKEIGQVVELINDIADQTNLLALNAAIEAARAGKYGHGFAVVANEIRELAAETATATQNITGLIKKNQDNSEAVITAITKIEEDTITGQGVAQETNAVFNEIEAASEETAAQVEQTAMAAQGLANSSEQLMESAYDIEDMSEEINTSASDLATMSEEIKELVQRFSIGEVSSGRQWSDRYAVGVELIDEQHQGIFERADYLLEAVQGNGDQDKVKDTLDFMAEYIDKHFRDEEEIQREYNYPDYERHLKIHHGFEAKIDEFRTKYKQGNLDDAGLMKLNKIVTSWLIEHIKKEDQRVAAHIKVVKDKN